MRIRPAIEILQGDVKTYPVSKLNLLDTFTRASYQKETGVQAPAFDPTIPVKRWFDITVMNVEPDSDYIVKAHVVDAKTSTASYKVVDTILAKFAATVNLPGHYSYPTYTVETVRGYEQLANGEKQEILPWNVSTYEQAQALRNELIGSEWTLVGSKPTNEFFIIEANYGDKFPIVWEAGERRRLYSIVYEGLPYLVGRLLEAKNIQGVGSPGTWHITPGIREAGLGAGIKWIPQIPKDAIDTGDPFGLPVPQRDLLPNEEIKVGFGGGMTVVKKTSQEIVREALADDMPARISEVLMILRNMAATQTPSIVMSGTPLSAAMSGNMEGQGDWYKILVNAGGQAGMASDACKRIEDRLARIEDKLDKVLLER